MTAKRRKRKLKTSFKFFLAVFLLAFLILVLKLCGGGDEPEKNITVEPSDEAIISVPTVEYERHNEFIRIKRFTDGEKQYSYPILDGYSAINVRVEKFVNELLITQNTVYLENVFYNASYYSMKFSDGSCLNYDVRNNMPMELEKVAPPVYEKYGNVPFMLGEKSVTVYTDDGEKEIDFSEYGGVKYLPYTPSEYIPAKDGEKVIALTFDDGPRRPEITAKILDKLVERQAKATFFVLGLECPGRGETLKRIVDSGCEIGNHTWRHEQLNKISRQEALDTVNTTQQIVYESTGIYPKLLRPPYGDQREDIMEELGMFTVKWSIDPEDWKIKDPSAIVAHVKEKAYSGAIVLMHDVYDASCEAALELIDYFCDNGWRLVTVSELFDLENTEFTTKPLCFKE